VTLSDPGGRNMTLNRLPEMLKRQIIDLQKYHELTQRMKTKDRYYYWQDRKKINLYCKLIPFIGRIDDVLSDIEKGIFYMRYVQKYPIIEIVKITGYSKRMIQYKLNDIVIKLEEGLEMYRFIKKNRMQQNIMKEYVTYSTTKKVQ